MFCTHAQFFNFRQPLNCQPVTCNMAIYGVCILLRGSWGLAPQAFHCESMPTPLNLTYILPYDCPCFARMRNSFTSVDLATIDLSTCQPVDLSSCRSVNLSITFLWQANLLFIQESRYLLCNIRYLV